MNNLTPFQKGLIVGVINGLITFMTAFLAYVTDNDIKSFADITAVTWTILAFGGAMQMFIGFKLLLTDKPQ